MTERLLAGKRALITGARKGIGKATVEAFAREGASVWACARSADAEFEAFCADLSKRNGIRVSPVFFDLCESRDVSRGIRQIKKEAGSITTLVNCAGIVAANASFAMTAHDDFMRVIDINLAKQLELTQFVVRIMEDGGAIVNLSSIAATTGMLGQYAYACSKGGVETWTKMLAQELGLRNIRVNAVAPGFVNTDMGNAADNELLSKTLESTALKRMAEPYEIANTIVMLASDCCSYVTGQTLHADGGAY